MDDDTDAAWDQQQQDERHRFEAEALEKHRQLLAQLRKERKEFNDWMVEHRV